MARRIVDVRCPALLLCLGEIRCRQASIRDVAKELKLDLDTVKTLEMQYMRGAARVR
jgi:hypothetical protein